MAKNESSDPLTRILKASNRNHLDTPFRSSSDLRSRHFPGAGGKLSHNRLTKAYLAEFKEASPDWKLLAHGTWPWLIGHVHDLALLQNELEQMSKTGEMPFDARKRETFVEKFSEAGTAEIEIFVRIFANGGPDFQKAVMERLRPEPANPPTRTTGTSTSVADPSPRVNEQESKLGVADLDPITRAKMALIGTIFFFVLSWIPLGIQFWRQPDQGHWIVMGVTGFLGLLTIGFGIDYGRKRP